MINKYAKFQNEPNEIQMIVFNNINRFLMENMNGGRISGTERLEHALRASIRSKAHYSYRLLA
jgi:hypothetical protein